MRRSPAPTITWIAIVILALVVHVFIKDATFSLIPLSFLLSTLVVLLKPQPLSSVIGLGLITEILSVSPPGLNMVIVLIPWLVRQLLPFITLELSLSLLGLLAGISFLQATVSFMPELTRYGLSLEVLPWRIYFLTIFLTAGLEYIIILIWQEYIASMVSHSQPRRLA